MGGPAAQNPPHPEYASRDMGWTSSMGGAAPDAAHHVQHQQQQPQQPPHQQQYPEWHPNAQPSPAQPPPSGGCGAAANSMPTPGQHRHPQLQDSPDYQQAFPSRAVNTSLLNPTTLSEIGQGHVQVWDSLVGLLHLVRLRVCLTLLVCGWY